MKYRFVARAYVEIVCGVDADCMDDAIDAVWSDAAEWQLLQSAEVSLTRGSLVSVDVDGERLGDEAIKTIREEMW